MCNFIMAKEVYIDCLFAHHPHYLLFPSSVFFLFAIGFSEIFTVIFPLLFLRLGWQYLANPNLSISPLQKFYETRFFLLKNNINDKGV